MGPLRSSSSDLSHESRRIGTYGRTGASAPRSQIGKEPIHGEGIGDWGGLTPGNWVTNSCSEQ
jgi:hypothetical protein